MTTALYSPEQAAHWLLGKVSGCLTTDSRQTGKGDGFIAWPGAATDGRIHVETAVAAGASACLVERGGKSFKWTYESLEGRVEMSDASRQKAGIGIEAAGPGKLAIRLHLNGKIAPNEERMTHVSPRFPGVVKAVKKKLGDPVAKGEVLATVESNESLRTYDIVAEIDGTVIRRNVTPGEFVSGQETLFTIADLSTVWADFSVYRQDFPLLRKGQPVMLEGGPGMEKVEAKQPALVGGIGIYKACCGHGPFTHVDTRGYRARWRGTGAG